MKNREKMDRKIDKSEILRKQEASIHHDHRAKSALPGTYQNVTRMSHISRKYTGH